MPSVTLAQESSEAQKSIPIVLLSTPSKEIQQFLKKHIALPTEPFVDNSAEKAFSYRVQKEIRKLLATEGYFSPSISMIHQTQDDIGQVKIIIDPGDLTRIGEVNIVFQGEINQENKKYQQRRDELRKLWSLKSGKAFRSADWEQAKAALLSAMTQEDFAIAQIVNSQATIDPEKAFADLSVEIDSGPIYYFGEIQINGVRHYDHTLITNLAPFKVGDTYRRELLNLFQIALQKAPQFSTATVNVSPDPTQRQSLLVVVDLTETNRQRFAFGGGYSSNNGARGEINFHNHNFLGKPWSLNSRLRLEQKRQTFTAGVDTLPDQNNINYSLGATLQMTDIENLRTTREKVALTRNYQTQHIQMLFGVNWQRENKKPAGAIHQLNEALVLDWYWRRQYVDDPLNVRRGDITEVRIDASSEHLLSTQDFIRTYARHQSWWPMGKRDVLYFRGEVGYTIASSHLGIPQEYLYRAGGIRSLRGYDFNSIGLREGNAIVGGRTMATGTIEYTHWLTHQWGAAAFADIGSVADSWQKMHPFLGYGGGVRWRSPAGPIALDLGRSNDTGTVRFHFSLAVAF